MLFDPHTLTAPPSLCGTITYFCVVFQKTQVSIRIFNWATRAVNIPKPKFYYFLQHSNPFFQIYEQRKNDST